MPLTDSPTRRLLAEGLGTALLLAVVVGSGIMGENLADGNVAIALLANSLATGAGLTALILCFGPVSGAHFNPVVSLVAAIRGELPWRSLPAMIQVQVMGGVLGVLLAHFMFELPLISLSTRVRYGSGQWVSEFVATFGLLGIITAVSRRSPSATPLAVGLYITSAYWFTSSTSFANPAVTLARAFTDTFAGIRLGDVFGFVVAQAVGGLAGSSFFGWLVPRRSEASP